MDQRSVRRLSAILAADVVGYSRMMGEDEAGTLALLRRLRDATLAPAVEADGGRIVKGLGDGWLVAFDSAAAAVRCAVAVQDALAGDAPMRLRIGVHIGDVTFEDGDIYGDGVNLAARLEAIAAAGGVAISDTVWSSLDGTLRPLFTDCGPRSLKNIATPVRVWARGGAIAETPAPGLSAAHDPTTVSVAPFSGASGEDDHLSLAEGLPADLETELARFRWLDVVRHDADVRAPYVLGGAVRGAGARVRVTAHLTYAPTGRRIWSERWDRTTDDLFAVQDALTAEIVASVCPAIDDHEKALIGARPIETLTVRELGLRTNAVLGEGDIDGFDEAERLVARAIALEPSNPDAHVQKALLAYRKAFSGAWPPAEQLASALDAARHALRLDPRRANAHGVAAVAHAMLGETDRALAEADRLAELNPNAWGAPHGRSAALAFAPPDWVTDPVAHARSVVEQSEITLRMAPRSSFRSGHLFFLGLGILLRDGAGDLGEAIGALDRSATEPGATWWPSLFLAAVAIRRGDEEAARARIREARQRFPALSLSAVEAIFGQSHLGQCWRAEMERLPDAGLPRD